MELARRARSSNRGNLEFGAEIEQLCAEIEADRVTLRQVMERLEIHHGVAKPAGAWGAEKLGRLKLNGRLRGYSPLSRLLELELLYVGITGKMQMWKALERALGQKLAEFDFAELAERAAAQRTKVESLHLSAAMSAFPDEPALVPDD